MIVQRNNMSAFRTFPSSRLHARVHHPDFSPFQAPSPATHFRHPQVALPRSFPSFLTKFAHIVL
jgi:hypothetical protein